MLCCKKKKCKIIENISLSKHLKKIPLLEKYNLKTAKDIAFFAVSNSSKVNRFNYTNGNYIYVMLTNIKYKNKSNFIIKITFTTNLLEREEGLKSHKTHNNIKIEHKLLYIKKVRNIISEK